MTGHFTYPPQNLPAATPTIGRRLQVRIYDLNSVVWGDDARYYVDAMYLHYQDTDSGNNMNNASYREFSVGNITSNGYPLDTFGPWEEAGHPPEAEFLEKLKAIEGVSQVRRPCYHSGQGRCRR